MNETLRQAAEQVISGTTGQVIDKAGYASIGTGIGLKVAEQTPVTQSYFEAMIPQSLTEWAGSSVNPRRSVSGNKEPV